jgi:hypothetical protein
VLSEVIRNVLDKVVHFGGCCLWYRAGHRCASRGSEELSVCEVLRDASKLNGKTVSIRAELWAGRHGWRLADPACGGVDIAYGRKWARVIVLAKASQPQANETDRSANEATQLNGVQILEHLLTFLDEGYSFRDLRAQVIVTFTGTVDWADPWYVSEQWFGANGFGMENAFVRLRYHDVRDIVIKSEGLRGCE